MDLKPFNKAALFKQLQRDLPHRTQAGCTYFATWRLADCLPLEVLARWKQERVDFHQIHPLPWDAETQREYEVKFVHRLERWADKGYGSCVLRQPEIREIMVKALHFFDGDRYELGSYVVMPNHLHVLMTPHEPHQLSAVLHSWKSYTAKMINRALGIRGTLWMDEIFDHAVRSEAQLARFKRYFWNNPTASYLEEGTYSRWQRNDESAPPEPSQCKPQTV